MGLFSVLGIGTQSVADVEAGAAKVVEAVGNAGDQLFTSDEEKAQWSVMMAKVKQAPLMMQAVISANSVQSTSKFIAWSRSALIWVLVFSLGYNLLIRDFVVLVMKLDPATVPPSPISVELLLKALGSLIGVGIGG